MINALEVTNKQDILAIHSVVSPSLKKQIEQAYPELFRVQFDFSDYVNRLEDMAFLPFFVGQGLVDQREDYMKSLIVSGNYTVEIDEVETGHQIIRFFSKKS